MLQSAWNRKAQALILRVHGGIAFAADLAEDVEVDDLDVSPAVADTTCLHQRMGYDRNAVAPRADHLCHPLLRQREMIAADQIADTQ